jgi:glucose/mannose-6-phosphate isomerase
VTAFRDQVASVPGQLAAEPVLTGRPLGGAGRLIVAGMGGSAAAGELASLAGGRETVVVRGGALPAAPRDGDVLLAVSYSGETMETLSVWEDARNRGLPRGAVASGGALLAAAVAEGAPHCRVPGGFAPRTALGHLIRGVSRLAGFGTGADWTAVSGHLRRIAEAWEDAAAPRVRKLTDAMESAVPALLVPEPELAAAANRWVADLAENAKAPAMVWALPEASHNRIMAVRSRLPLCCVAVGAPWREDSRRWWAGLAGALNAEGVAVHVVDEPAPDAWSYALGLAYVGDWVSLHLAERLGVDPFDISLMDAIKQRLRSGSGGGQGEGR